MGDKFGGGNKFGFYGDGEYGRPGYADGPELGNQESGYGGDNTPQPPANFATQQVDSQNKAINKDAIITFNEKEEGELSPNPTQSDFQNKTIEENLKIIDKMKGNIFEQKNFNFDKNTNWPITFSFNKIKFKFKIKAEK